MPTNYSPAKQAVSDVVLPLDGDVEVVASVNGALQDLADAVHRIQLAQFSNFQPIALNGSFYPIRGAAAGKYLSGFPSELWCAVGGPDSTTAGLYISATGHIWSNVSGAITNTPPGPVLTTLYAVAYDSTLATWVAVGAPEGGDSYIISSTAPASAWTERSTAVNVTLRSVASNDAGMFVACGDGGTIIRSADGITWATAASGIGNDLRKVIWVPSISKWIAVGGAGATANLLWSSDAITWTNPANPGTAACFDVAWDGTAVVATCTNGTILRSTTGTSWMLVAAPGFPAFASVAIAGDPSGTLLASAEYQLFASLDHGLSFIPVGTVGTANVAYLSMDVLSIAFGAGRFIACGGSGQIGLGLRV